MDSRFGFVTVSSVLTDQNRSDELLSDYIAELRTMGGERWSPDELAGDSQLFMLVATGGTERAVMTLVAERRKAAPDEPVYLIAHPGHNSLPASLEVLARLQQDGARGRIFYLKGPDDSAGLKQIEQAVADVTVWRSLRKTRIGLIGDPSDWLVASMPDTSTIEDTWGPEVIPIPMSELDSAIDGVTEGTFSANVASLISCATDVVEPSQAELDDVARVQQALRQLVDAYGLDALTVRCFDLVLNRQTTGCYGLAQLTDEGIIAGCEGDLVTTVGLLWAYRLLGETPWMANPAQLDPAENTVLLAHCTVPRSMVTGYRLRSHFESGLGVGIQGTLPLGPVTLFRIGGTEMDALWLAEGNIVQVGHSDNLCRTQAEVHLTMGAVSDLLNAPLGNHLVLVPGHHADRLRSWWSLLR